MTERTRPPEPDPGEGGHVLRTNDAATDVKFATDRRQRDTNRRGIDRRDLEPKTDAAITQRPAAGPNRSSPLGISTFALPGPRTRNDAGITRSRVAIDSGPLQA
jgi:hypothetical protein